MEVFLQLEEATTARHRLLHVRGGVSGCAPLKKIRCGSSPRPWRCFRRRRRRRVQKVVFSTSVEVFPGWQKELTSQSRLLHVRGGVSAPTGVFPPSTTSSPRPWRCFRVKETVHRTGQVFSTSVEVFPRGHERLPASSRLLHVRGGVSGGGTVKAPAATVFSTSVEVFEYFGSWRGCCLLT